jgi:hypothetical protein
MLIMKRKIMDELIFIELTNFLNVENLILKISYHLKVILGDAPF